MSAYPSVSINPNPQLIPSSTRIRSTRRDGEPRDRHRSGKATLRKSHPRHKRSSGKHQTRARKAIPTSFYQQLPEAPAIQYQRYPASHFTRRPKEWRSGFQSPSRTGIRWLLFRWLADLLRRSPSTGNYGISVQVHSFICYAPVMPHSMIFDLRKPPLPEYGLVLPSLGRAPNTVELYQVATSPAVGYLVISHPRLPWYIEIYASSRNGITVHDVLLGLYESLKQPVAMHEYYTSTLQEEDREMLTLAFLARCGGKAREKAGGLRRVDFLGRDVCFIGLEKGRKGVWELKTAASEKRRMIIE
ncbi:hypothetical protein CPB83DRAFT_861766 [Crepidotus variabilis]|uniref:DUF6699 domain-containing protein n=1 Tax=Crepidotus variabilis TaxID=179855 RepID=A0A9P6E7Z2_9AGAR|nr:hypothetical protein CPB83DRAFT_861766 [Crepidotus variabilis]